MKKIFTTFLFTFILINTIFSQTNSEVSGNAPVGNGYQFNFYSKKNIKSDLANCIGDKILTSQNQVTSATIDTINSYLSLDISLEKEKIGEYQLKFSYDNCSQFLYKIREGKADSIIKVKIKSSIDINGVTFVINGVHPVNQWLAAADKELSYCSISANEWTVLEFKSHTKTWDNKQIDKNAIYGISIVMKNHDNIDYVGKLDIAYIHIGENSSSDPVTKQCNLITDNAKKIEKENIVIYPNPATNVLNVIMDGSYEVSLFNMLGENVFYQENEGNSSLEISTLPTGIYYIQITKNGELLKTEKVIIK